MDLNKEINFCKWGRDFQMLSPPELELDIKDELFRQLIEEIGTSKNIINSFNNWFDGGIIENQISFVKLPLTYGVLEFCNATLKKPFYESQGKIYDLTPKICREDKSTYSGQLEIDVKFTPHDKEYSEKTKRIIIGNIPILLGSKYCHLCGKTAVELIKMGECPNDPLGYFLIKGTEKIINIQEKLRASQIFTFLNIQKDGYTSEITCVTPIGTWKVNLLKNKDSVYVLSIPKYKELSVFMVFDILLYEILENNDVNSIFDYAVNLIMKYTEDKYKNQIKYVLNISLENDITNYDPELRFYKYIMTTTKMGKIYDGNYNKDNVNKLYKFEDLKKIIDDTLMQDLFPQIHSKTMSVYENKMEKANFLAYMISCNCKCYLGKEPDDRDNWINKRLQTGGKSLELLFNFIWKSYLEEINKKNLDIYFTNTNFNVITAFPKNTITENFIKAFGPNNWAGPKKSKNYKQYTENITDNLKRENAISVYSQIGKINVPTNSRTKLQSIRSMQNTQLGYVCMGETPEGERCGLVKNSALSIYISLDRKITDFENIISDLKNQKIISKDVTPLHKTMILASAKIYGWCNGEEVLKILKTYKRNRVLDYDVCIYLNRYNNILEYHCESSRLLRPLLVINQDTEELIINEKKLWLSTISELYYSGSLELIDTREEDDITLCRSIDQYEKLLDLKKNIKIEKKIIQDTRLTYLSEDNYNLYKYIYLFETYLPLIFKEFPTHDQTLLISKIVDSLEYNLKIHITNFLSFKIKDFLDLCFLYNNLKNNSSQYELLTKEFKIDNDIDDLKLEVYTHCEFNPISLYGVSCSLIPKSDCNAGPRTVYQASMSKQALSVYHFNRHLRFDTSYKYLDNPQRPIFENLLSETYGLNIMPSGQNPITAYLALDSNNEDAIVGKKEYFDAGFCNYTKITTYKYSSDNSINEVYKMPKDISHNEKFHAIMENGLPKLGSLIKPGDCILAKVIVDKNSLEEIDNSIYATISEEGIVDRILVTKNIENILGNINFNIRFRQRRSYKPGDKLASRYSQKGTLSKIVPSYKLPRISSGINKGLIPDFFINPNSTISRMTQGKFKEFLTSKSALYSHTRINSTPFSKLNEASSFSILEENGDKYGDEIMEHPNGLKLKCKVFVAPCNYQCLKHHVDDKIQMRSIGDVDNITRQPIKGRSNGGGLRCGEMERDGFISHGSSSILLDRMMVCADPFVVPCCKKCGFFAIADVRIKKFFCKICSEDAEVGSVSMCYIFKLIINMLNAIGISVKLKLKNISTSSLDRKEIKYLI